MAKANFEELPLDSIRESVVARPKVPCSMDEVEMVLDDLRIAVDKNSYIPQKATEKNPALSDDYIFNTNDQNQILKNLTIKNFVGKVVDQSKGAEKRKKKGFPPEFPYVFQYACRLSRRDAEISGVEKEDVMVYIKINNRKIPDEVVFIISFHKNHPTSI